MNILDVIQDNTMKKSNILNIRRGKKGTAEIDFVSNGKPLTAVYPPIHAEGNEEVLKAVTSAGLLRATTAQTIDLIYGAVKYDEEHVHHEGHICEDIETLYQDLQIWTGTENLWIPGKGVYVYDNTNGKMPNSIKELEVLVKKEDQSVRFVPFGFNTGYHSSEELIKNSFLIAHVGKERAKKVAELSNKLESDPIIYAYAKDKFPVILAAKSYTSINSTYMFKERRFALDGRIRDFTHSCIAFGIKK